MSVSIFWRRSSAISGMTSTVRLQCCGAWSAPGSSAASPDRAFMSTEQRDIDRLEQGGTIEADAQQVSAAPVRILIAKPGLDGHDRGAKVLVRALRDAGFEVVYTGLFQTPEMIASAALQEDVQVIGLSILSGAHMALFPRIMGELRERGLDDVLVIAGGTIPKADIPRIKELGVAEVFGPGTRLATVVDFIRDNAPRPSLSW